MKLTTTYLTEYLWFFPLAPNYSGRGKDRRRKILANKLFPKSESQQYIGLEMHIYCTTTCNKFHKAVPLMRLVGTMNRNRLTQEYFDSQVTIEPSTSNWLEYCVEKHLLKG